VIGWFSIAYGAALSALVAGAAVRFLLHERRVPVIVFAAASAAVGPIAWNSILHHVGGHGFFVDAPIIVFPISWQDTGSGVFATAAASVILGFGALRTSSARALLHATLACGIAALLVDIYLY
jgi:hypothetical protein